MKWVCYECGIVPCYLEVKDSGGETPESCAFNAERYNANWKLTTRTVELKKQRDELIEFLSEVIEAEELKEDIAVIIDEATEDWINEQIKEGENNLLREQLGGKVRSKK